MLVDAAPRDQPIFDDVGRNADLACDHAGGKYPPREIKMNKRPEPAGRSGDGIGSGDGLCHETLTVQCRHCEKRSDEAIQDLAAALDCFAELVIGPATSGRTRWLATTRLTTSPARHYYSAPDCSAPARRGAAGRATARRRADRGRGQSWRAYRRRARGRAAV